MKENNVNLESLIQTVSQHYEQDSRSVSPFPPDKKKKNEKGGKTKTFRYDSNQQDKIMHSIFSAHSSDMHLPKNVARSKSKTGELA